MRRLILQQFGRLPIRRKVTLLMLVTSATGLVLAAAALIGYARVTGRASAVDDLATVSRLVADNTTAALAFGDARAATETLAALRAKPEIESGCLYQKEGNVLRLFAGYVAPGSAACRPQPPVTDLSGRANRLVVVAPVELEREEIGTLAMSQSLQRLSDAFAAQVAIMLAILGASFAISFALALPMQRVLSDPILRLAETARRVSESRDYGLRAPPAGHDEVGRLVDDFNQMLGQIGSRDVEIRQTRDALYQQVREKTQANQELEQALARLKDAQAQLVQSEKMASLGALVAGIAHEINTPVGIGVTAASTLQAGALRLKQQHESGAMKRSDLERFVAIADESTRILLKNLQRAADLIQSFKQVAVDQSSGECRRFSMKSYIDEVLLSLAPKLKNTALEISVDCPEALTVETYPGALAQIITNFVSNSLLHAFGPGDRGHLRFEVSHEQGWVTLRYRDDGRGIAPEHLPRIFDPFFTTKRGAGGSGLGLHVVYNLVTQVLGGTIQLASEPGQGVDITVRFPANVRRTAP